VFLSVTHPIFINGKAIKSISRGKINGKKFYVCVHVGGGLDEEKKVIFHFVPHHRHLIMSMKIFIIERNFSEGFFTFTPAT
jgi:hypothetical protein